MICFRRYTKKAVGRRACAFWDDVNQSRVYVCGQLRDLYEGRAFAVASFSADRSNNFSPARSSVGEAFFLLPLVRRALLHSPVVMRCFNTAPGPHGMESPVKGTHTC